MRLLKVQALRRRVLRGGSFANNSQNVRCANRNRNEPDNRNNNIGFRLCLSHIFQSPEQLDGTFLKRFFQDEVKNGGACSWPRRSSGRAYTNRPVPWPRPGTGIFYCGTGFQPAPRQISNRVINSLRH
ncbi:MAG: SUMF1/EgtB/PvdO family nonheme iron enzyme [Planctomycetota bacterium]|jgi:hypothetical protein|nr:SUMF1/EgtB/PvdO family nonheme iron enzyme [Planctomycetota bacterium]MDP6503180.1 SUMF1/EgtB/PvdO family nonheme iron enzyme [Planctomycetota bacterium]